MNKEIVFAPLSAKDFMALGAEDVAYVKPFVEEGRALFAIHTADGRAVALVESRDLAVVAIRQNGFEPVSVH